MANGKKRRNSKEIFLDSLRELLRDTGKDLVPNHEFRQFLKWDEDKYNDTRRELIKSGQVRVGQGQGGKVGLPDAQAKRLVKVFISYSHADSEFMKEFKKHINPIVTNNGIELWDDGQLIPGEHIDISIRKKLLDADIVVMLVSIDYLNSYYCMDIELTESIERHEKGECRVVPIILRNCMWSQAPFKSLKALPDDGKPVNSFLNLDDAFTNVAKGFLRVVADVAEKFK